MELTKEQIQRINKYLDIKQVNYIDIRIEILDHIILDVENLMLQKYSFDEAIKIVILKWNKTLETTSSIYLGHTYVKPKPIIEKLKNTTKTHTLIIWGVFIFSMISMSLVKLEINLPNINFYDSLAKLVLYSSCLLILCTYILMYRSKQKTSYRFLYESQVLPIISFTLFFGNTILNFNGNIETLKIMMLIYVIVAVPFGLKLYRKHTSIVKKYTIKCN